MLSRSGIDNKEVPHTLHPFLLISIPNQAQIMKRLHAADVAAVKAILQARINYMVGDGNGPGGAWYPEAMDTWESQSRVVSSGH